MENVPTWSETCTFLWRRQVAILYVNVEHQSFTEVHRSVVKLKFHCSSGDVCSLKMKDDNFSDVIETEGWKSKGNWKCRGWWFKVDVVFHLRLPVLSCFEGCSPKAIWTAEFTDKLLPVTLAHCIAVVKLQSQTVTSQHPPQAAPVSQPEPMGQGHPVSPGDSIPAAKQREADQAGSPRDSCIVWLGPCQH